jgi:hypothetical protein
MTPKQARIARWTMVGVIAIAAFTVLALGQSMWWIAFLVALLIILSFVFGRYEAGNGEDSSGST